MVFLFILLSSTIAKFRSFPKYSDQARKSHLLTVQMGHIGMKDQKDQIESLPKRAARWLPWLGPVVEHRGKQPQPGRRATRATTRDEPTGWETLSETRAEWPYRSQTVRIWSHVEVHLSPGPNGAKHVGWTMGILPGQGWGQDGESLRGDTAGSIAEGRLLRDVQEKIAEPSPLLLLRLCILKTFTAVCPSKDFSIFVFSVLPVEC